jgi:hypothetical protein
MRVAMREAGVIADGTARQEGARFVAQSWRIPMRRLATLGVAGVLALSAAVPLAAAPLSNAVDLKAAAADTTQIRWRGHRGHGWVPGAVIGGLAAGAIIGSQAYRADPYYYGGYAYDAYPYDSYAYSPGYSYAPGYYRRGFRSMDRDCLGDYDSGGVRC